MAEATSKLKRERLYTQDDVDLGLIKDRQIAVLGYGSPGHAQAQNMRDQGQLQYRRSANGLPKSLAEHRAC